MKKIGIIGGGQLGKMMILDARRLDYYVVILDPTLHCPAHNIADEHIVAVFDDAVAIRQLAEKVDVVTYEFEHIGLEALRQLESSGHKVYPSSDTLFHIQNKYTQKQWLQKFHIPVPEFQEIPDFETLTAIREEYGYPFILKTCTGGYDGKGNALVKEKGEERQVYESLGAGKLPLMVERFIPFEKEISVLACKSINGEVSIFPIAENKHINSILDETLVPAAITEKTREEAFWAAKECVKAVDAVGMLCVELFVTRDGSVLVNEMAPRPHNSGHYTIEGCYTSQYEQHIRAILGLPLGNTALIRPTAMKNVIGEKKGPANVKGLSKAYQNPNVKIHIYGKETVSVGRKMGHITGTADTLEEALNAVRASHKELYFETE